MYININIKIYYAVKHSTIKCIRNFDLYYVKGKRLGA